MNESMAYCGLICRTCPIHLATLETDVSRKAEMRVMIANELSRIYGTVPKPEIITDCEGCKVINGKLFTGCADCDIRKCAALKNVLNCAYYDDYACEKLNKHLAIDPAARERLDNIRINLKI